MEPHRGDITDVTKVTVEQFDATFNLYCARKERNIRVNVLRSGTIDTPALEPYSKEAKDFFVSIIPGGRMGRPKEIATAELFLASSDSCFVSGIELFVDGGTAQI